MPQVDLHTRLLRGAGKTCHTLLLSAWVLAPATTHSVQQGFDSLQRRKAEIDVKKITASGTCTSVPSAWADSTNALSRSRMRSAGSTAGTIDCHLCLRT
jgi:hypothetical protein